MSTNPLVKLFGKKKMWVNYALLNRNGKMTKVPFSPITRLKASSTDAKTWGTHAEAIAVNAKQIGIALPSDKSLLFIDIDHCLNGKNIEHEDKEKIAELLLAADTYTEISPSGTGLHLYFELTGPLALIANRHANFEAYTSGRYFTVTGASYYSEKREIRTITPAVALELLAIIGYPWGKEAESAEAKSIFPDTGELSQSAGTPETIIKKMLRSKGGEKIKALMDGDTSAYKGDGSAADMALLSHLAFWTKKDGELMESIWMGSALGAREKTQKRKDYRDRSIKAAIKGCKEIYQSQADKIESAHPNLDLLFTLSREKEKIFTQNTENMCRILRGHAEFEGRLQYDTFKNTLEIRAYNKRAKKDEWRSLQDSDAIDIQTHIQILFPVFGKVGKDMIYDAIVKVSRENTIDSAIDYLEALIWDGEARLDEWLIKTFNTPDNAYYRAAGSNWYKGLVKRLAEPGCKFDHVLVLEGEQGIKKSTSLAILGSPIAGQPSWHVETTMATDNKDFFMQFEGKAIIEFSEGETLSRTEVKKMKAIITTQSDKYRPAYARLSQDFPRRCVFAMTTNQKEYLKDETGNRRWLPVACDGVANVEWLKDNLDQLYAEAYARVIAGNETIYEFPEEETYSMQSQRRIQDPNTDLVIDWYFNKLTQKDRETGVTIHQAYRDAISGGMMGKQLDKFNEMNLADIMRTYLRLEKRRTLRGGIQSNRWFETKNTPQVDVEQMDRPMQPAFGAFGE